MQNILSSVIRHLSTERDRLVLWLPVFLGLGIGLYFLLPGQPPGRALIAMVAIACALLRLAWKSAGGRMAAIALLAVALGMLRADMRTQEVAAPVLRKELFFREVEGRIADIQIKEKGEKLILTEVAIEGVQEKTTPLRVSVSLRDMADGLAVGDSVRLKAMLFPPPTPAMPGSYDFSRMFYYDQLGAVGYSPKQPEVLEKADPDSFEQRLNALRLSLTQRILAPMTPENGWISAAMMVGEMSGVSKEAADAMRDAGIYHVLSISGLHMSLAVMLVFVTVRFLLCLYPPFALRAPVKKIAALVGLVGAFAYLMLAGHPVPAVRSFIMVACVMVAILFDRRGISIYSIAWAALLVLLWQPESLLGASFQLSFAATLCILAFYERYSDLLYQQGGGFLQKFRLYFLGIMLTSLVATLATTPLVLYHFNRFTLWGIAANMLMLPLVSFWIMPSAVVALLLMPFGLEYWPLVVLDMGVGWMMQGARWLASLPYAAVALPPPSFAGILLAVGGGLWLCLWRGSWRLWGIAAVIFGVSTIALHKPYDMLISDDASKVALRMEDGNFLFLRGKPDSFDGEMWLRVHGLSEGPTLKDRPDAAQCDKQKCLLNAYGKTIVITKGKNKNGAVCEGAPDIVISSDYLDRQPECAQVPLLLDKAYLRASGAVGLRFEGGDMRVRTAAEFRGQWPWVAQSRLPKSENAAMMPADDNQEETP